MNPKARFKIVDRSEIPNVDRRATHWDEVFAVIPKGKAAVFSNAEVWSAYCCWKRRYRNRFPTLKFAVRGKKGYIIETGRNVVLKYEGIQHPKVDNPQEPPST